MFVVCALAVTNLGDVSRCDSDRYLLSASDGK